ncbi:MAG: hypothetical protein M1396_06640 [Chloroflexi bacterium]|nr:hypothetical protein [Chloroflexota bacterium]
MSGFLLDTNIPSVVRDELAHEAAPVTVRNWVRTVPVWLEVRPVTEVHNPAWTALDAGERAALTLAATTAA